MAFLLPDLDRTTRDLMLEEFENDVKAGAVHMSKVARPGSDGAYFSEQRRAFDQGTPDELVEGLLAADIFMEFQTNGNQVNIPSAAARLGDGQFVAYYCRAVCRRALEEGREIEIYRGQETLAKRGSSEASIGSRPDPAQVLADLRSNSTEPWKVDVLGQANSGIAVKLV